MSKELGPGLECGCLSSPDSQSEGGTVTVNARSARGGRVPVKVLTQWKEGIEVMQYHKFLFFLWTFA